jgi:YVTN family beta-propeller protein
VIATVPVGTGPFGVAANPAGTRVYVANSGSNTVSVIDTTTLTVSATVPVGTQPVGVAVNPGGTRVYVANNASNTVSVIDTTTLTVSATVPVGTLPVGVAVNPAGTRVYVANLLDATVSVGAGPVALGQFIGGLAPPVPVGGAVTGVSPTKVTCENLTKKGKRMVVEVALPPGAKSWDCEAAGLVVSPGDTIKQTVTGIAD